jgi:hypothetical protein
MKMQESEMDEACSMDEKWVPNLHNNFIAPWLNIV